jgi:hypothetical protein
MVILSGCETNDVIRQPRDNQIEHQRRITSPHVSLRIGLDA